MPFGEFITNAFSVAGKTWFIWLPVLTVLMFLDTWRTYVQRLYMKDVEWSFIEVRIPREIRRGPKAMEQFFATLYSFTSAPEGWAEVWWEGGISLSFSFEIAWFDGEIHFFIRTPAQYKNIIEANLYAFYPDLEIVPAEDYINRMPEKDTELAAMGLNFWGVQLKMAQPDPYPIRMYPEFESMDEYSQIDPISGLIETMSKLPEGEELWLQIVISPAGSEWKKKGEALVKKLQDEATTTATIGESTIKTVDRSPGKTNILKAIEENVSKPGFYTLIRYLYIAPKVGFNKTHAKDGILGVFNQYSLQSQNGFKRDNATRTDTIWHKPAYIFPKKRAVYRRRNLWRKYRQRYMTQAAFFTQLTEGVTLSPRLFVLNTEALATIYHYPSNMVLTAPMIQRVESKKVGPPAGLPIFGDAETLEGFKTKQ